MSILTSTSGNPFAKADSINRGDTTIRGCIDVLSVDTIWHLEFSYHLQTITSITARTYKICEQDHKTLLQVASSQYEAQSSKSHQPVLTS
jgi:hypothetical protein